MRPRRHARRDRRGARGDRSTAGRGLTAGDGRDQPPERVFLPGRRPGTERGCGAAVSGCSAARPRGPDITRRPAAVSPRRRPRPGRRRSCFAELAGGSPGHPSIAGAGWAMQRPCSAATPAELAEEDAGNRLRAIPPGPRALHPHRVRDGPLVMDPGPDTAGSRAATALGHGARDRRPDRRAGLVHRRARRPAGGPYGRAHEHGHDALAWQLGPGVGQFSWTHAGTGTTGSR